MSVDAWMASTPKLKWTFAKKLDAAERQLNTAIWLWFNAGDLVSINTLAGAAYAVFDDLLHHSKTLGSTRYPARF